jgi:AcrR family transcriptional regulator
MSPARSASSPRAASETRDQIDAAAVRLFAERGYHATTMRDIANAVSVQTSAIYYWYQNKEAILLRLQERFLEDLSEAVVLAIARGKDPTQRLALAVREHVIFHGRHPQEAFVTDSEIRALSPEHQRGLVAERDVYQDRFIDLIDQGAKAGMLRVSDSRIAAYAILLQCTGVALWFSPDGPKSIEEVADIHIELVLGAVGATRKTIDAARDAASAG